MIRNKDIQKALDNKELVYFYQPKVSMVSGKIIGAEALARWIKSDGTIIQPNDFIPIAEESGFITKITLYLFRTLVKNFHLIKDIDPCFNISFNVSAEDLFLDNLTEKIIDSMKHENIPCNCIDIEITESKLIKSTVSVMRNMSRLVEAGVGIDMDDFGTGYSSLNILANYPFTSLKLDYDLINGLMEDVKKQAIIKAIVRMAHLMNISIVAEGVENREQYILLQDMGCSIAQGFWISRPLPFDKFLDFIRGANSYPASVAGRLHMMHIDHILWYRKIVRHVCTRLNSNGEDASDEANYALQCQFYCHISEDGLSLLQGSPYNKFMEEIEDIHRQLHDEAEKIICMSNLKNNRTNRDYAVLLERFNRLHWDFVRKIDKFENAIIYDMKY